MTDARKQRGARSARSERGAVTAFFVVVAGLFFTVATFSIALGQVLVTQTHIQVTADAASRAAAAAIRDGAFELGARDIATLVALQTTAIEPGVFLATNDVLFGDYDYERGVFNEGGDEFAPAVRVFARRTNNSVFGPLNIAVGLFYRPQSFELEASATASFGCREVVFAIDVSGGMEEELTEALDIAREFKALLDARQRSGDRMGLTFYAADGVGLPEFATSGSPFWVGGVPEPLSLLDENGSEVEDGLTAWQQEGVCQDFRESLPGGSRGSCAGRGDHHGIDQALALFGTEEFCASPRERLIVLITSSPPCAVWGHVVSQPSRPYLGGTADDAVAAADRADAIGVSIAPIAVDAGAPGDGDWCDDATLALQEPGSTEAYLETLRRGFVEETLVDPTPGDLQALLDGFNANLIVRAVE